MNPHPGQHNQHNQADNGGTVFANQSGKQHIRITNQARARQSRAGWAVLVILLVDAAFFLYGNLAYSGRTGDAGDLWRVGVFLVLLAVTGSLIRRWFRAR